MNILVAGASGLIGREVARLLKADGHTLRTVSRDPMRAEALRELSDDVRLADITRPGDVAGLCTGIDVVVSALGAPVSPQGKGRRSFADVDRAGNLMLLSEATRAGVRRFVYVGVYTTPVYAASAYVRAHTDVEAAIRGAGIEHGFVRPTGVFGAFLELVAMARKGPLPLIGAGAATTNPVHERDVAEAVLRAVLASGSTEVDLGGPESLTRKRIAELAFAALGTRARLMAVPAWLMRAIGFLYGIVNRRMGEFLQFLVLAATHDSVAPSIGTRALGPYLELAARPRPRAEPAPR